MKMIKPTRLFLGGLPCSITHDELLQALGWPEDVKIDIKRSLVDNKSLGYAFLTTKDEYTANLMVNKNYNIKGRTLFLQYCKKRSIYGLDIPDQERLFLKGIPLNISDEELTQYFNKILFCKCAYAIRNKSGHSKGFGFIELWISEDANYLAKIGIFRLCNQFMMVEFFKSKTKETHNCFDVPTFEDPQIISGHQENKLSVLKENTGDEDYANIVMNKLFGNKFNPQLQIKNKALHNQGISDATSKTIRNLYPQDIDVESTQNPYGKGLYTSYTNFSKAALPTSQKKAKLKKAEKFVYPKGMELGHTFRSMNPISLSNFKLVPLKEADHSQNNLRFNIIRKSGAAKPLKPIVVLRN